MHSYLTPIYEPDRLTITQAQGCRLFDKHGNQYLDFTSGIGVNVLGHQHPLWQKNIQMQLQKFAHISNRFTHEQQQRLAQTLCQRIRSEHVIFTNSGAESNECAIKAARKYQYDKGNVLANEIITLKRSFHGRTITTLSASGQDFYHKYYHPFTSGFRYVEALDIKALKRAVNAYTCAIMIELVQGEGGVHVLPKEYVQQIAEICRQKDILLILDEVQTGMGRCGSLFAFQQYGIEPDIVTCAKGIANGLPLGAVLFFKRCKDVFHYKDHGSTFGGNPVACAGANAVLAVIDDAFLQEVKQKGEWLKMQLQAIPQLYDIEGLGCMIGASIYGQTIDDVMQACQAQGLLILAAKHRLRILPPLVISYEELQEGIQILTQVLS